MHVIHGKVGGIMCLVKHTVKFVQMHTPLALLTIAVLDADPSVFTCCCAMVPGTLSLYSFDPMSFAYFFYQEMFLQIW